MPVPMDALRRGVLFASALAAAVTALGCHSASATFPAERTATTTATPGLATDRDTDRATDRAAVRTVKVDPRMYGLHDSHLTSLTHRSTRSIRLWDAGVTWPDLKPTARGRYHWARLDDIVRRAHHNGTEVTLALARTPAWAAATRAHRLPTDPPNLTQWRRYVKAVMTRYSAKHWHYQGIANYQVWNEPNIATFWTGTPQQMAQLVKAVHDIGAAVSPKARIIAPSMVARLGYQQSWIKSFYRLKVGGKPVWKYVDAAAFSMYPLDVYPVNPDRPKGRTRPATPEDSIRILGEIKAMLRQDGVRASLPIWNTEINYGMRSGPMGGHAAIPIPDDLQVAYVIRTYLLNAAQGVRRVDWYAYDMTNTSPEMGGGPLGNTLLTDPSDQAAGLLTPAGKAFTRVQGWLKGATLVGTRTKRPCIKDSHGTYTCAMTSAAGRARVYWNPYHQGQVTVPAWARSRTDELGTTTSVTGGTGLQVGPRPVLVRSGS
jgi:polysaccharide biosynthesis protein PslG